MLQSIRLWFSTYFINQHSNIIWLLYLKLLYNFLWTSTDEEAYSTFLQRSYPSVSVTNHHSLTKRLVVDCGITASRGHSYAMIWKWHCCTVLCLCQPCWLLCIHYSKDQGFRFERARGSIGKSVASGTVSCWKSRDWVPLWPPSLISAFYLALYQLTTLLIRLFGANEGG